MTNLQLAQALGLTDNEVIEAFENNTETGLVVPVTCPFVMVIFIFGHLHFWSSSFLVVFIFGRPHFWSSSFLAIFIFGRLHYWSSSFLVVFIFSEVVFHFG